jgi:NitT/TauT family transport system permease protein
VIVVFPAIIPELVDGIRVAIGVSWGIQIVRELIRTRHGMGQVFSMAMPMPALDLIVVGVLWITILAATTDMLLVWAARIVTRWVPIEK